MNWQAWCGVVVVVVAVVVVTTTSCAAVKEKRPREPSENTLVSNAPEGELSGEDLLPKSDECGLRQETVFRIMYGEEAPLHAYPWIALLGYGAPVKPLWACGGALINERYVVTAGHCIAEVSRKASGLAELVKVRLGEHNIATSRDCTGNMSEGCSPLQDYTPEEWFAHEDYHSRNLLSDDIALVRLDRKVVMGPAIQPVCLPPPGLNIDEFLKSRDAIVAGWGATEEENFSRVLQVVNIPYARKTRCAIFYPFFPLLDEQVCFGGRGKMDSCHGDSGGPIFQSDLETYQFVMLGIVSFGPLMCGLNGVPGVYTSVPAYRDWIVSHLKP